MEDRPRHCWECLRRSLVCDFIRPQCKRCSTSGIVCPGYEDKAPFRLKWLPPGRSKSLAVTFYRYRGLVIRSLRNDINQGHKRASDVVLAGIITLLLVDVSLKCSMRNHPPILNHILLRKAQQGASPHWRYHMEGLQKLILLRGGIRSLARSARLAPLLHCFVCIAVIGDTVSPTSHLATSRLRLEESYFILENLGNGVFDFQMCPKPLFAEIIRINHLRVQAWKQSPTRPGPLAQEAYGVLNRINTFSSERWADSKPSSKEDWRIVGESYQAAVSLYCILSLQSLSVLPLNPSLRASCASCGRLLQDLLNEALSSPRIKRSVLWPLVVLGVLAVNGGAGMRAFVREHLPEMSRHIGSYVPLMAKALLEKFWASGETSWDACFDKPYTVVTQIAVDLSQLD
ncbi:C6 finger domain protein, putative [Aspergillus fumigatus Af293]|uniref:C6 finger domain protein, putative n=1 Tax=Aspergillus fumigatus (strain ATCC MYA-4609 / CBS 101355 / FGSC A1100 / Af293) TaxID=330879 RepID=Q4WFZ6_ASPFU|nr:C6 finger domain protein, putative [Aspergillus fumigatus Af293]EAL86331.1 C6 finger domain protein, putative [Aspergillus fumigatus Af293]